jgi:hypothetical protein
VGRMVACIALQLCVRNGVKNAAGPRLTRRSVRTTCQARQEVCQRGYKKIRLSILIINDVFGIGKCGVWCLVSFLSLLNNQVSEVYPLGYGRISVVIQIFFAGCKIVIARGRKAAGTRIPLSPGPPALVRYRGRRAVHVTATAVATSEQAQMCVQSPFAPCVPIF